MGMRKYGINLSIRLISLNRQVKILYPETLPPAIKIPIFEQRNF